MAAAKSNWKVLVHEIVSIALRTKQTGAAKLIEQFVVSASTPDEARKAARDWLSTRKKDLRSLSVSADPAKPKTLLAYISPKGV